MVRRKVQRFEVVVVRFELGACCDGKSHAGKNASNLVDGLCDGVFGPQRSDTTGKRKIDRRDWRSDGRFKRFFLRVERLLRFVLERVEELADHRLLFRRDSP